jgi:LL-diaminopimelate aminotransferase
MDIRKSRRLEELPPYIFSEINAIKAAAQKRGVELLSLGIGDPDKPTPQPIVKKLQEAVANPKNHVYSPYNGTLEFRKAVATWFEGRFGVSLDAEKEVVALIGSKEAIAHFPVAFCDPGDKCLYPSPGYPVFAASIALGGGVPVPIPMTSASGFLPDLNQLESLMAEHRPKYAILNFPSNPTSVVAPRALLEGTVALAKKYGVILVSDNAYSEMYYDEAKRPPSLLEIPGAKEVAIEFHSFSKTFNMTGWRIGFAVGNETLVEGLLRAKTNIDSGPLLAVQEAAIFALQNYSALVPPIRQVYAERRKILTEGLKQLGIEHVPLDATFFLWAKVPGGRKSMEFTRELIDNQGLVVTPGIGFGEHGENFFRLAMTVDTPDIHKALEKLQTYLNR